MAVAAPVIHDQEEQAAFAAAREICRRHFPGFVAPAHLLNPRVRSGVYAVGAFCRMIHEAIDCDDHVLEGGAGMRNYPAIVGQSACCSGGGIDGRLQLFRERIEEIYSGSLELPSPQGRSEAQHALHAFALTVRRHDIPKQYFLDFAEGRRMEGAVSRFATWASLEKYCHRTGGVVALMLCGVLGMTSSAAGEPAAKLGVALRLTDILNHIKRVWARGRLFLPLEDLARFRYSERDLASEKMNQNLRELLAFEIARARQLYRQGAEAISWLAGDASRLAAAIIAVQHAGLLDEMERQGCDIFAGSVRLSWPQRLRRGAAAWRLARRGPDEPLPGVFG